MGWRKRFSRVRKRVARITRNPLLRQVVGGLGGGIIDKLIPGGGKFFQGLVQTQAESFKEIGASTASFGIGEFVSNFLGIGGEKGTEDAERDKDAIAKAVGKAPEGRRTNVLRTILITGAAALAAAAIASGVGAPAGVPVLAGLAGAGAGAFALDPIIADTLAGVRVADVRAAQQGAG